jgi:predicted ArsR family transcriptional regulator
MFQTKSPEPLLDTRTQSLDLTVVESDQTQVLVDLLSDRDCRRLLAAADSPMTAMELVGECEIPRATVYRKLNRLEDAGLIESSHRIRKCGLPPTQYQRTVDSLQLRAEDQPE